MAMNHQSSTINSLPSFSFILLPTIKIQLNGSHSFSDGSSAGDGGIVVIATIIISGRLRLRHWLELTHIFFTPDWQSVHRPKVL
jgi:hypothetical protein